MAAVHIVVDIAAPTQKIFAIITDLPSYSKWLPESTAFTGTTEVSETPITLGTTYTETSPSGIRTGKVIEFEPPSKVVFHQPMKLNPAWVGLVVDLKVEMLFNEGGEGVTTVERNVFVGCPWVLRPLKMVLDKKVYEEGVRMMDLLKKYVEILP